MMLAWATDLHLDHAAEPERTKFMESIRDFGADALVITGDISNANKLKRHLDILSAGMDVPIYFVLGNHDFYGGWISEMRDVARGRSRTRANLHYLTDMTFVSLSDDAALVGHDGWYDARIGRTGRIILNDFQLIRDFSVLRGGWDTSGVRPDAVMELKFRDLAEEAAGHFRTQLVAAFAEHRKVVLATHVPPFAEACWHMGRRSDIEWLPYFTSKTAGDALMETMEANPDKELLVLCGHSHGEGSVQISDNLKVLTGGASYRLPSLQEKLIHV